MLDTGESTRIADAATDRPAPATDRPAPTTKQDPSMAAEFALLRDVKLPLNPHSLPDIRLEGDNVVINIATLESANSQEYKSAIMALQARGCTVTIDRESSLNFTYVQISAPKSLFSAEAIAALEAKQNAEKIISEQAAQAREVTQANLMSDWGC